MIRSFLLMLMFSLPLMMVQASDGRMVEANMLNGNGEYAKAIEKYEQILKTEVESPVLYFNLGYAHYKSGSLAPAILNFERARLLAPNDPDINYNLELAYSQTVDKIDRVGEVFFVRWINGIKNKGTSNAWAILFLVSFSLMVACAGFYFFGQYPIMRKFGFYVGLGLFILCSITLSFSISQKSKLTNRNTAIVFSPAVTVTSSPDERGTELVVLHEGTKVKVVSRLGEWCEIQLSDGNVGWLKMKAIEII
ncbi:MAG: tetratricopeptide repeat protein [Breznakibacter sp.]